MSLANQMGALSAVKCLNAIDAADTTAASSAYVAVSGFEGQIAVVISTGIADAGSITYTFSTATDDGGTGAATIVPIGGALTAVTTSNDDGTPYIAIFDTRVLKGYLKVIGTVATGGVLVAYTIIGRLKTV
jgi:hypothetical protein